MFEDLVIFLYIFLYFGPVYVPQQHAHNWVVKLQSHNRGHRDTVLCPSDVFNSLRFIPYLRFLPVSYYCSSSFPSLPSSPSAAASAITLVYARSIPSFSRHLLANHSPGLHTVLFHRSIIVRVMMHCANAFCLFRT